MCGGGSVASVLQPLTDFVAAAVGNTFGGPLGAAGADFLTNEIQGKNLKQSLIGGAEGGVGAGIGDVLTGSSLTGSGLTGVENAASSIGSGISNIFGSGTPSLDTTANNLGNLSNDPSLNPTGTVSAPVGNPSGITGGAGGGATAAPAGASASGDISSQFNLGTGTSANPISPTTGTPTGAVNPTGGIGGAATYGGDTGGGASTGNAATPNLSSPAFGGSTPLSTAVTSAAPSTGNITGNLSPTDLAANNATYNSLQASLGQPTAGGDTGGGGTSSYVTGNNSLTKGGLTGAISNFQSGNYGTAIGDIVPSLLAGGGLVTDALRGNQAVKGENQVKGIANQEATQGANLESYLTSGTLPPSLQAAVNQATASAKASIKSRYASMGQSGSSSEQEDLAAVDQNAAASSAQTMLSLLNSGVSESGAAANLFSQIMQTSLQNDNELSSALAGFTTALAGGTGLPGNITIGR